LHDESMGVQVRNAQASYTIDAQEKSRRKLSEKAGVGTVVPTPAFESVAVRLSLESYLRTTAPSSPVFVMPVAYQSSTSP
jgi:hypothetical protein